jgi:hypothetical protein
MWSARANKASIAPLSTYSAALSSTMSVPPLLAGGVGRKLVTEALVRWPTMDLDQQTPFRRWLEVPARNGGKVQMGLIPNFYEMKENVEEAFQLLRRAVAALEKLAAEQKRANDLYAEVNQVLASTSAHDGGA